MVELVNVNFLLLKKIYVQFVSARIETVRVFSIFFRVDYQLLSDEGWELIVFLAQTQLVLSSVEQSHDVRLHVLLLMEHRVSLLGCPSLSDSLGIRHSRLHVHNIVEKHLVFSVLLLRLNLLICYIE